ncbi:hypothetical protein BC937DRAFT_86339 [Endogone sp. FLAS-F59071]|nr:hypothetical protein BC937DRAFT_86339 [Endogone sp. FLAS-F59071]|eukprot:RUS20107.1 hypothetical protein BC937DRAFT_86339 [Endogone sp. FLAS-F59071]
MSTQKPAALVIGGTGAVGKALTRDLLRTGAFRRVTTAGRRPVVFEPGGEVPTDRLVQYVVDFENLHEYREAFRGHDVVFCALGTTRAAAGSVENFIQIEQDYVINIAAIVAEENPSQDDKQALSPVHFVYCSSIGAKASSPFLYFRTKGETENILRETSSFTRMTIVRPSGLEVEERRGRSTDIGEAIAFKVFAAPLKYFGLKLSVPVAVVARAMRRLAIGGIPEEVVIKKEVEQTGMVLAVVGYKDVAKVGKMEDR